MTLAKLVAKLTTDTREYRKGLTKAQSTAKSSAKGIGSTLKAVKSAALPVAAAITAVSLAAVGAVRAIERVSKAIVQLALDAASLEGVRKAFDGIAGSAEVAAGTLGALRKGSLGLVKDAELMRTYNEAAQLVSKTFADQLPEAMQYLRKVSASTGRDMAYLLDSLVRGVGRLSPMILDNLQIQVSLEEATARAAKMFGVQAEALSKAQLQAGMTAVVMEKLAQNTAQMPDIAENAATKWGQFQTKLANIKDTVGLALAPVLNVLSALGTAVIDLAESSGLLEFGLKHVEMAMRPLDLITKLLSGDLDQMGFAFASLFGPVNKGRFEEVVRAIQQGVGWIKNDAIPTISGWIRAFSSGFQEVFRSSAARMILSFFESLQRLWRNLQRSGRSMQKSLVELAQAVGLDVDSFDDLVEIVGTLVGGMALGQLYKDLTVIFALMSAGAQYIAAMARGLKRTAEAIKKFREDLKELIGLFYVLNGSIPPWLLPSSPPPLERGLRGTADAVRALASSFAGPSGLQPVLAGGFGLQPAAAGGNTVVIYGPVHVHGVQDARGLIAELQELST